MAGSVSLKELLNLAIGSPELGAVNFNALHSLLHGLLEHLQLGDVKRNLSQEEMDFMKPGAVRGESISRESGTSSLFHQLQDKMARMETKLQHLDALPSSTSLMQCSRAGNEPVQEMWQLMQLKKKMELNEEGVHKVMSSFQELLNTFNNLKRTTDMIQENLASLGDMVTKINIHEVQKRLQDLDGQIQNIPILAHKLAADRTLSSDKKQKNTKNILGGLAQLPSKHDELVVRVQDIEAELKRLDEEISTKGIPEDLLQQLQSLREDMEKLFFENKKGTEEMGNLQKALHHLNKALQELQTKTNKLEADLSDTATLQAQIHELDRKKLDREELMLELNVKADKRALESKVGKPELDAAVDEVTIALNDLKKKLASQEDEWQSMLGKLLSALEAKLSRSDLDSVRKDLDELWRTLRKHLSTGDQYEPDGAAGSRKKLFEKVKCISCDRPVTMATGPHLVTVRSANLVPKNHSLSAEYGRDRITGPNTSEIGLMGVDGKMYKGRLDKSLFNHVTEKEPSGVKTPQPPYKVVLERARSATSLHRQPSSPVTRSQTHTAWTSRTSFHVPSSSDIPMPEQQPASSVEPCP
ncbi:uncharacterized protein C16orf96 homolog [Rhinophrynus dorsalis]